MVTASLVVGSGGCQYPDALRRQGRAPGEFFGREIPSRSAAGFTPLFTQICNTTDDDGALLSDQAIIDHMNFR
jgi:hypothetical protein